MVAEAVAAETGFTQFGILGPLEVSRAGHGVPLGGPRQRAVLALLLLEAGRVVSMDRLAEGVWAGHPPEGWVRTLQTYVFHLRQALEPGRARGAAGEVLVTRDRGYLLRVDREHLDATVFEEGFTAGRTALEAGRHAEAAQTLRKALELWRGPVLANLADYAFTRPEAARLEELRLAAVEARIDADLALGRHDALTAELDGLVGDYPLRERLHAQLMLALYRCGRQAEALAAYRRARTMLAAELGLEPGEELRALEQAVLRHQVPPAAPEQPRHNLPARLTSFVGREDELAGVGKLVGQGRLVTLTGPGGAGKTRLAVEFAAIMVGRLPDGVWLAELAGVSDPGLVGAQVMQALGVRQTGGVPLLEALGYRLRSAELLLVLDNCEHLLDACAGLVAALLAGAPGLRVLATSREVLGVPGEAVYVVPPLAVPAGDADPAVIAAVPAVRLFADRASSARVGAEVLAASAAAVGRICRELDGLPLAIELAAARASVLSVEEIESHLADKFRFLAYRRPAGDPRHQALKTAIDWSFDLLPAAQQRALAQLSVFAGGFALAQAAQVCCGGDRAAALDVVDRLVAKSLVIAQTAGSGTRYRMLETIRQYAAGRLADAGKTEEIRRRHAEAFLDVAEREQDLAVLSREQDNFRAALDWALPEGGDTGPRLARALGAFWLARGLLLEGQSWLERALATGPADPWLRAELLRLLGTVLYGSDVVQAESVLSEGSRVAAEAGLLAVQARIRVLLGGVREMLGRPDANAFEECQEIVALLESEGDLAGLAEAWIRIGNIRAHVHGDMLAAVEACERAATYARTSGNHVAEQDAQAMQGGAYLNGPIPVDVAISRTEQFLDQASGAPWAEAPVWQTLSGLYALAGRFADARAAVGRAQSAYTRSGAKIWPAVATAIAGEIELIAGDPAAAEQQLRKACEELRAIGERGFLASALPSLAEAVYAQGRLDEAWGLTEEAKTVAVTDDIGAQAPWRATRAKILACRGQHTAARQLADQAQALAASTSVTALLAEVLEAKAEVSRLAGATADAETCLRAALDLHEQRRASALADRARAALASLLAKPG
jgi:predicted ATPase/DNA-binding SARP family transcriptional activator